MKYLRFTYLLYGILGIFAGLSNIFTDAEAVTQMFDTGNKLFPEYSLFSKGFGNAIMTIAIVSLISFFVKDYFAKKSLTIVLTFFNIMAAYLCLTIENIPTAYAQAGYFHILLALLYGIMGFFLIRKTK